MTTEELTRECNLVIAGMKTAVEGGLEIDMPIVLHWPITLDVERLANPLARRLARPGEWQRVPFDFSSMLNDGDAKTMLFGLLRVMVADVRADAIIFGTDAWSAKLTPEGMKHCNFGKPDSEWNRHVDRGFDKLVKLGWATREEALQVVAQSAVEVVQMAQQYRRRAAGVQWIGELLKIHAPQEDFRGRAKMYGRFADETLGENPHDWEHKGDAQ